MLHRNACFVAFLVALCKSWVTLSCIALAAPAPKAKTPAVLPATNFVGTWEMSWGGQTLRVWLSADGEYLEDGPWGCWVGKWSIKDGVFKVDHAPLKPDGSLGNSWPWQTKLLPGKRAGDKYGFALKPPKPDA